MKRIPSTIIGAQVVADKPAPRFCRSEPSIAGVQPLIAVPT